MMVIGGWTTRQMKKNAMKKRLKTFLLKTVENLSEMICNYARMNVYMTVFDCCNYVDYYSFFLRAFQYTHITIRSNLIKTTWELWMMNGDIEKETKKD